MSSLDPQDEFFIGYLGVPPRLKRFLLGFIPILVLSVLAFAFILPPLHFDHFNLGKRTKVPEFEGLLVGQPSPHLLVPRTGEVGTASDFSLYLLSGTGKTSPKPKVLEHVNQWVKLKGTPFHRNHLTVIATKSAEPMEPPTSASIQPAKSSSLGEFSLKGEIVDGKCYPGVMKPGRTKTHRSCAIRCLSGGVPPVFVVHNQVGDKLYFLLSDLDGKAVNDKVLDLVADPVQITGEVIQYADAFVLKADPATYKLL